MKVLIAEDNRVMADVIRFNLLRHGIECDIATNGQIAQQMLVETQYDLLLTDYQMPLVSGEELVRYARTLPNYADVPMLLCSAKAFEVDFTALQAELGIAKLIRKPFSPSDVVRIVQETLSSSAPA